MNKLFTEKQIGISALIGGPVPPGILFYLNYKRIGKEKEAYISMAATLVFTTALFFTLMEIPSGILDKIPNALFTGFYGILVYVAYKRFLAKEIDLKLEEGYPKASNWAVTGVTILGLVLNLAIIFTLALNQPAFEGDKLAYGSVGNEIYYDKNKTSVDDVEKLNVLLTNVGYFHDEYPSAVYLDTWQTPCVLTLQIDKENWKNDEVLQFLDALKADLRVIYKKDVTIILEHYDLTGKKSEKSI